MNFIAGFLFCLSLIALMRLRRMWHASSKTDLFYTRSIDRLLTKAEENTATFDKTADERDSLRAALDAQKAEQKYLMDLAAADAESLRADLAAARDELNSINDDWLYQKKEEILLQRDKLLSDLAAALEVLSRIAGPSYGGEPLAVDLQQEARAFLERTATEPVSPSNAPK